MTDPQTNLQLVNWSRSASADYASVPVMSIITFACARAGGDSGRVKPSKARSKAGDGRWRRWG
ncbi:hypothetical protein KCP74_00880 [Salmonella enterica subsp. enterica]|nr:hypothetical protein KCP74_00880 [Salmonella enterica subsp. enterica]